MIHEVVELFKQDGIALNQFPITFDSWYGSSNLVEILHQEGFDQIVIHTKSSYVFTIDGKRAKLSEHKKEIELQDDLWGCKGIAVARKAAESPTFGKVILLFFEQCSMIKSVMVFGKKLRACEALSIWKQHNSIEQFWRRLKHDLQIHRIRLQGREGVYGMVAIKLLAYLVMEKLSALTRLTFRQIMNYAKRQIDLCSFFAEHFHRFAVPQRL
jgi:transposase